MFAVNAWAFVFHVGLPVYSCRYQSTPGKKPLVQSREVTSFNCPFSNVRGDTKSGFPILAAGISCSNNSVCFSASANTFLTLIFGVQETKPKTISSITARYFDNMFDFSFDGKSR